MTKWHAGYYHPLTDFYDPERRWYKVFVVRPYGAVIITPTGLRLVML